MTQSLKSTILQEAKDDLQSIFEYRVKLITLMALTNKYSLLAPIQSQQQQDAKNEKQENDDSGSYDESEESE